MSSPAPPPETTLRLTRIIAALAEIDLRVGGRYRLGMKSVDKGIVYYHTGVYRQVCPPEKLVYTWTWEGSETTDTLVTVELRDLGGSTELVLTHELFKDRDSRDQHGEGWSGCLEQLAGLVSGEPEK